MAGGGPGGAEVGRVSIRVVPNTSGFRNKLRTDLQKEIEAAEKGLKAQIGVEIDNKEAQAFKDKVKALAKEAKTDVKIGVDVDTTDLQKALLEIEAFDEVASRDIEVKVKTSSADLNGLGKGFAVASRGASRLVTNMSRLAKAGVIVVPILAAIAPLVTALGAGGALAGLGALTVAAGAVAAVGAGGVVGGFIMMAAKSKEVSDAWTKTKERVTEVFKEANKPVEGALVSMAPKVSKAFELMRPNIERVSTQIAAMLGMVELKLPAMATAIGTAMEKMFMAGRGPLESLINSMPRLIESFGNFFQTLGNSKAVQDTWSDFLGALPGWIEGAAGWIDKAATGFQNLKTWMKSDDLAPFRKGLEDVFNAFKNMDWTQIKEGATELMNTFGKFLSETDWQGLVDTLGNVASGLSNVGDVMAELGGFNTLVTMFALSKAIDAVAGSWGKLNGSGGGKDGGKGGGGGGIIAWAGRIGGIIGIVWGLNTAINAVDSSWGEMAANFGKTILTGSSESWNPFGGFTEKLEKAKTDISTAFGWIQSGWDSLYNAINGKPLIPDVGGNYFGKLTQDWLATENDLVLGAQQLPAKVTGNLLTPMEQLLGEAPPFQPIQDSFNQTALGVIGGAQALPGQVAPPIAGIGGAIGDPFNPLITSYMGAEAGVVSGTAALPGVAGGNLAGMGAAITPPVEGGWQQLLGAVQTGNSNAAAEAGKFPGMAEGELGGLGSIGSVAGAALGQGLIAGILSMIGAARSAASSLVNAVREFLPGSPAEKGPFSGHGWTPYRGRALVEGFAQGISSAQAIAVNATRDMITGVHSEFLVAKDIPIALNRELQSAPMVSMGDTLYDRIGLDDYTSKMQDAGKQAVDATRDLIDGIAKEFAGIDNITDKWDAAMNESKLGEVPAEFAKANGNQFLSDLFGFAPGGAIGALADEIMNPRQPNVTYVVKDVDEAHRKEDQRQNREALQFVGR